MPTEKHPERRARHAPGMDELLGRILSFAEAHPAVRAVVLTGSRARALAPADALSDLDVELYYADPSLFADLDRWLAGQPDVWVDLDPDRDSAALARGDASRFGDRPEGARLVIFAGGRKVDFSLIPVRALAERVDAGTSEQASWRGFRVLLDRDGLANRLAPAPGRPPPREPPSAGQFRVLVEEYWFECYHVAKYLARGDLWPARFRDWSTKELLLRMVEWHARSLRGWDLDTWHLGIRLREWAGPGVWERLHGAFGRFDAEDGWRALEASTALFRALAPETAERLGHPYPDAADRAISSYVARLREAAAADPSPPSDLVVRRARLDDHAAIRALQDELDREHAAALPDVLAGPDPDDGDFAETVANEARCFLAVAELGAEVVGFVDASWHDPEEPTDHVRPWCRINNIAIRAEHRRRGVATALVRAAEAWARVRGLPDVRLDVYEFNVGARRLYERLGYRTYRRQMRRVHGS